MLATLRLLRFVLHARRRCRRLPAGARAAVHLAFGWSGRGCGDGRGPDRDVLRLLLTLPCGCMAVLEPDDPAGLDAMLRDLACPACGGRPSVGGYLAAAAKGGDS